MESGPQEVWLPPMTQRLFIHPSDSSHNLKFSLAQHLDSYSFGITQRTATWCTEPGAMGEAGQSTDLIKITVRLLAGCEVLSKSQIP